MLANILLILLVSSSVYFGKDVTLQFCTGGPFWCMMSDYIRSQCHDIGDVELLETGQRDGVASGRVLNVIFMCPSGSCGIFTGEDEHSLMSNHISQKSPFRYPGTWPIICSCCKSLEFSMDYGM